MYAHNPKKQTGKFISAAVKQHTVKIARAVVEFAKQLNPKGNDDQ